ncbi:Serine/threonine-protein kinase PrkC [Gimesia panareensis]|uniref:Serine/threonine-protein kinase PrkC n=1 Tax=Gimesia panareensis TaxID=2527978 RepID=A0A518FYS6_9PLAN|nr:serine/threonine-protein kinase [Gimesia panareensis]QDV21456.1 Serine/threonine-protein kinase PrkC [Gimesia panareensis]
MKFTFAPESKPLEGFTIKRAIDRGGFGEVYYALTDSGKEVALKLLQQNMDVELRGVTQCLNLKHPNLVTIFDVKTDRDGDHWVVMEYVSGQGLDKALQQYPNGMPMEQVRYWLSGISEGLSYLHSRGLVHRDLKPSNVFRDGEIIKVGDVGLSKFITHSRRSANTQSVGTVHYMAPEVARGRYGKEVDVYAAGILVYEMITGVVPFDGESTAEILMKHLSEKPDLSRLPAYLRAVVGRALEKDPQQRISDIKQFKQEFERALFQRDSVTEIPGDSFEFEPENQGNVQTSSGTPSHANQSDKNWARILLFLPVVLLLGILALGLVAALVGVFAGAPLFLSGLLICAFCGGLLLTASSSRLLFSGLFAAIVKGPPPISDLWDKQPPQDVQAAARTYRAEALEETQIIRDREQQKAAEHRRRTQQRQQRKPHYARSLTPLTPRFVSRRLRTYDLCNSMVKAVVCTLVITAGIVCFTDGRIANGFWSGVDLAPLGLLIFGTLLASWSVLLVSKLTEGKSFDNSTRRIIWLGTGVLVGSMIYLLQTELLLTDLPDSRGMYLGLKPLFNVIGPYSLVLPDGQPSLISYVVFFGLLFCFRRWWWHADAFRPRKFKVSSVLLTVFVAYAISAIWAFPVVMGLTWAAIISSVVQLSASWIHPDQRIIEMKEAQA